MKNYHYQIMNYYMYRLSLSYIMKITENILTNKLIGYILNLLIFSI